MINSIQKSNLTSSRPSVIVIAGSVGSGKSTVCAALSKVLGDVPVITFDDYGQFVAWPDDMGKWIAAGADPKDIRVPKLKDDLCALLQGKVITDPLGVRTIKPSEFIILEEPSGRERDEISEYIDLVVFIDTPQDICVTRLMERVIDMKEWMEKGTFVNQSKEDLIRQLDAIAQWIDHYRRVRLMYVQVSGRVKEGADLVVNGMDRVEEITRQILKAIRSGTKLLK